jgi:hypothetical protein
LRLRLGEHGRRRDHEHGDDDGSVLHKAPPEASLILAR